MRLIMTLLVRNEEDIIEANLNFHRAQGVDFFIVTDNGSEDSTLEILEHYAEMGWLHLIHESDDDYDQSKWVTRMARAACIQFGADWVINNDADEFWYPIHGSLKTVLESAPKDASSLIVERTNFLPRSGETDDPFWRKLTVRERNTLNHQGKVLPGKVCHRASPTVFVSQGNHGIRNVPGKLVTTQDIQILHFPLRSYDQFERKIRFGGAAYERNTKVGSNAGRHWRDQYQQFLAGRLPAVYREQLPTDKDVQAGLQEGLYVEDLRLMQFFES
jgi:hypothetical protein